MPTEDLLALDEAMAKLAAEDPTKARFVELRFFAGLSRSIGEGEQLFVLQPEVWFAPDPLARRAQVLTTPLGVSLTKPFNSPVAGPAKCSIRLSWGTRWLATRLRQTVFCNLPRMGTSEAGGRCLPGTSRSCAGWWTSR